MNDIGPGNDNLKYLLKAEGKILLQLYLIYKLCLRCNHIISWICVIGNIQNDLNICADSVDLLANTVEAQRLSSVSFIL